MWKLAAAAFVCGLAWTLLDRRRVNAGDLCLRLALASFGFFALITAVFWVFSPGGTARLVSGDGADALMQHIVQGRGLVVFPFGIAALLAAYRWPARLHPAILGPAAYNVLMTIEATRAQFTPLATPERWLYVGLHAFWAISFLLYVRRLWTRADAREQRRVTPAAAFAAYAILLGGSLYLASGLLVPGASMGGDPLLIHSSHGFGASLTALGLIAFGVFLGRSSETASAYFTLTAANLLLAGLAAAVGLWPLGLVQAAWAGLFAWLWLNRRDDASRLAPSTLG